jgi:hypothetical protein
MKQAESIEEIMQRIRAQVGASQAGAAASIAVPRTPPPAVVPAGPLPNLTASDVKLHDLSRLRTEVDTALNEHRQVGQVNPRPPGLHNQAIQFVKKAMRRSLTWYTRPLQLFEGAVIRALQQVTTALESHEDALRKVLQELEALRSEVHKLSEELHETAGERGKDPELKA